MNVTRSSAICNLLGINDVPNIDSSSKILNKVEYDAENISKQVIEKVFNYSYNYLRCYRKVRNDDMKLPRQVHMTLLVYSGSSLRKAGEIYEKDHATVLWAKNKIINILTTKYPANDYKRVVQSFEQYKNFYPNINLSELPGPWHDNAN